MGIVVSLCVSVFSHVDAGVEPQVSVRRRRDATSTVPSRPISCNANTAVCHSAHPGVMRLLKRRLNESLSPQHFVMAAAVLKEERADLDCCSNVLENMQYGPHDIGNANFFEVTHSNGRGFISVLYLSMEIFGAETHFNRVT